MSAVADVRKNRTTGDIAFACATGTAKTELVALITARKIRVIALVLSAASAVNVTFQSASTDISKVFTLSATDLIVVLPWSPFGWFDTAAGEALSYTPDGVVATTCTVVYVKI